MTGMIQVERPSRIHARWLTSSRLKFVSMLWPHGLSGCLKLFGNDIRKYLRRS